MASENRTPARNPVRKLLYPAHELLPDDFPVGISEWQCLHLVALSGTDSRQKGHFLVCLATAIC